MISKNIMHWETLCPKPLVLNRFISPLAKKNEKDSEICLSHISLYFVTYVFLFIFFLKFSSKFISEWTRSQTGIFSKQLKEFFSSAKPNGNQTKHKKAKPLIKQAYNVRIGFSLFF